MIVVRFRSEHVLAKSAFRFLVVFLARFYDEFRLATALGVLRCYTVLHADAKRKEKVVGERWISTLLRRRGEYPAYYSVTSTKKGKGRARERAR